MPNVIGPAATELVHSHRNLGVGYVHRARDRRVDKPLLSSHIDQNGVGQLVEMATKNAKAVNKDIIVGVCGEHGGEPTSIEFFHNTGLNYVSCSPYRIPVAIVAAAQAQLKNKR